MKRDSYSLRLRANVKIDTTRILFWFLTIDLFFLPYFSFMAVTISAPVMVLWLFFHFRDYLRGKEAHAMFVLLVTMVMSTAIGSLWDSSNLRFITDTRTTILRFFQYILCFGYYFFYKSYFIKKRIEIYKVILAFTAWVAIFAVLFMLFPREYAELKFYLNPADTHTIRYLANQVYYRFNYLWTDPNNLAYLLDGLIFFYVLEDNNSIKNKIIVSTLALISILATASIGGLIILLAVFLYIFLKWAKSSGKLKIRSIGVIFGATILALLVFYFTNIGAFINESLVERIVARFYLYGESSNFSGGRINDLLTSLNYLNPLFLLIGSGKEGYSAENGHIYWTCMYGLPSYIAFMYIVFGKFYYVKWLKYVWILPFFIAFTINIAIGEFKWMAILLMLVAHSRYYGFFTEERGLL